MQDLKDADVLTEKDITSFVEKCHIDMPKDSDKAKQDFIPRFPFDISSENLNKSGDHKTNGNDSKMIPHDDRKPTQTLSLFKNSIQNAMSYQAGVSPTLSAGTDVPIIVDFLIGAIMETGVKSEGIFRISPDTILDEVDELRRNFESGHYLLSNDTSPHTFAALLQVWFQELTEPIFPYDMYDTCMDLAKERLNLISGSQETEFSSLQKDNK